MNFDLHKPNYRWFIEIQMSTKGQWIFKSANFQSFHELRNWHWIRFVMVFRVIWLIEEYLNLDGLFLTKAWASFLDPSLTITNLIVANKKYDLQLIEVINYMNPCSYESLLNFIFGYMQASNSHILTHLVLPLTLCNIF